MFCGWGVFHPAVLMMIEGLIQQHYRSPQAWSIGKKVRCNHRQSQGCLLRFMVDRTVAYFTEKAGHFEGRRGDEYFRWQILIALLKLSERLFQTHHDAALGRVVGCLVL